MKHLIGYKNEFGDRFADYKLSMARKTYRCGECGGWNIEPGDIYRREIWKNQRTIFARAVCPCCMNKDL